MDQQALQALDFIRDQITECGEAPTHAELVDALRLSSVGQASTVVDALVRAGKIVRTQARTRNLAMPATLDLTLASTTALRTELARRKLPERVRSPMRDQARTRPCAFPQCPDRVPPGFLMCRTHWLTLPMKLRTQLVTLSMRGPEADYAKAFARAVQIIEKAAKA